MRRLRALSPLALILLAGSLAGCGALGVPDIAGRTVDSALGLAASPDPAATEADEPTPAFFSSVDGYSMTVPAGWTATQVEPEDTGLSLDLLSAADPGLGEIARGAVDTAGARVSMVGGDLGFAGGGSIPPGVAILIMPTINGSDDETEALVEGLITSAPRQGRLLKKVVTLPAGDAHRFLLTVAGDVTGPITMRIFLFSAGSDAIIVAFDASAAIWPQVDTSFDMMIRSLRFGV